jgi:hypothetical protein
MDIRNVKRGHLDGSSNRSPFSLAIITINHHHGDLIKKTIQSLINLPDVCSFQLFAVNNLPEADFAKWIKDVCPTAVLIENSTPKGFSENINAVIKANPQFPFYLLLNPDVICLPGLLDHLLEIMLRDAIIGIAGPRLMNMDGTVQPSARRFPNLFALVVRALHLDYFFRKSSSLQEYLMVDTTINRVTAVDWLAGSVMMLRKTALDQVGLMDERFVMYFEDVDLCYRMWEGGWKVCLVPEARAYHAAISESRNNLISRAGLRHIASAIKFFLKYKGHTNARKKMNRS